jgi:nucleoid DNA-binding protein
MPAKKAVKKAVKAKSTTKSLSIKKMFSKSEIVNSIAEAAELGKKQATIAIDWLAHIIKAHISKNGPGLFVFPGVAKFKVVRKPATKARSGKNPFTGEPMTFAAKPAHSVVKVRPLKKLKDSVK